MTRIRSVCPDMTRTLALAATLTVLFGGAVHAQPIVTVLDSVVLEQPDPYFLTVPISVVWDEDGFLVADAQEPRLFRYHADGRLDRTYGSEGEGPGEFKEAALALPFRSGQILGISWSPSAAQSFDRETGAFIERYPLTGAVETAFLDDGAIWVSGVDYGTRTALRRIDLESGSVDRLVPIPTSYEAGAPLHGIFPAIPGTQWADTLLVGFEPLSELVLVDREGAEHDRFSIPSRARRGTPDDPGAAIMDTFRRGPYSEVFAALSATRALHRRTDGSVLVIHYDSRAETPPVTSEVFVSVLSADRRSVCLDAPVPLSPAAQPAVGFRGDTMMVLEQVLVGIDVQAVVRLIEVNTDGCSWVDVIR